MENRWFVFWYGTDSDGSVICVDEVSYPTFSSALSEVSFGWPIEICYYDGHHYVRKASSVSFWDL